MRAVSIGTGRAVVQLLFEANMLRPGCTVSGPFMMALADATMYVVVMSAVGEVKLAITTSFNINFLRCPRPGDLLAAEKSSNSASG